MSSSRRRSRPSADRATSSPSFFMPQNSSTSRGTGGGYNFSDAFSLGGSTSRGAGGGSYSSSRKHSSSTSAYRRSPRTGYIAALWHKIKKMLRDLIRYARAHPFKIALPIVMALVSGGALTAVMAKVGLGGLARNIEGMVGAGQSVKGGYDAWYGSQDIPMGGGGGGGLMDSLSGGSGGMLKGAVKMASAFL